jgi:hypothetical protein
MRTSATVTASVHAAGTLPQPMIIARPGRSRRIRLLLEIGLFFLVAPVIITYAVYGLRMPVFYALQPVLFGFIGFLLWDRSFDVGLELRGWPDRRTIGSILLLFVLAAGAIAATVAIVKPDAFLALPRVRPMLWVSVLLLYPLLSVLAQELVFRTFFFHRYGPLFGERRWAAILANGSLFGFAHIMFYNPVAIMATIVSGCLFAWRYSQTRSFWAVFIEHTLYGWLIFTIGLGAYFFTGIANPGL